MDLYLDGNLVESIIQLEGSSWLDHFRLLSLRGNRLTDVGINHEKKTNISALKFNLISLRSTRLEFSCLHGEILYLHGSLTRGRANDFDVKKKLAQYSIKFNILLNIY